MQATLFHEHERMQRHLAGRMQMRWIAAYWECLVDQRQVVLLAFQRDGTR